MNFWPFKKSAKSLPVPHVSGRSFAAAEVSRILTSWRWDGGFSNDEIAGQLASIRSRSRELQKNSPHFKRYFDLFVTNVVGRGFAFKSQAAVSDADPAIDKSAVAFLQYHFWKWSRNRMMVDSGKRKSLAALCRLAAENWARDGECFILLDKNAQHKYGLSMRIVRPDACNECLMRDNGENIVRNGIEINPATYEPVAYWFDCRREDATVSYMRNGRSVGLVRIPADRVIHLYIQHDETQVRGIPLGHAVMKELRMVEDYNESEIVAAKDEANTLGVYHAPLGREDEIANLADNDSERDRLESKSEPGSRVVLPAGWDYDPKTPNHPNRELVGFKNSMLRDAASGLGVEYSNFSGDWTGVSYSSVRVGTLSERDMWEVFQDTFKEQVLGPIFEAWLHSIFRLAVSGIYNEADFDRLAEYEFRGRKWAWVDPMKDVQASVIAVEHGWKTDADMAADYGGDIDDNLVEQARVRDERKNLGLRDPIILGSAQQMGEDEGDESKGKGGKNEGQE